MASIQNPYNDPRIVGGKATIVIEMYDGTNLTMNLEITDFDLEHDPYERRDRFLLRGLIEQREFMVRNTVTKEEVIPPARTTRRKIVRPK